MLKHLSSPIAWAAACLSIIGALIAFGWVFSDDNPIYIVSTENPTTGELTLAINPELFCTGQPDKRKSIIHKYSYSFDRSAFTLLEHERGNENFLQIIVYCNQDVSDLVQPVANEGLRPEIFEQASNVIVTQRLKVLRFVVFPDRAMPEIHEGADLIELVSSLYEKRGVAVGACYDFKDRCYMAVGLASHIQREGEIQAAAQSDYGRSISMLWIGIDGPSERHLELSKAVALFLLDSLQRGFMELPKS